MGKTQLRQPCLQIAGPAQGRQQDVFFANPVAL